MSTKLLVIVLSLIVNVSAFGADLSIPQQLEAGSVTIVAGQHQGSGTLVTTKDNRTWVLTAGHVIESLRQVKQTVNGKGQTKIEINFPDVTVLQFLKEDGRKVGELKYDCEVVRYSDPNDGEDLALLRVRSRAFKAAYSIKFYLEKDTPLIGTDLYHCGSLLGEFGNNSLTNGVMSSIGRVWANHVYDQTNCTVFPGSSGGPVALKSDGRYVGMIVRGAGEGFSLMVPVRRIHDWSRRVGIEFILDPKLPVPTDEELKKAGIEEGGRAKVTHERDGE